MIFKIVFAVLACMQFICWDASEAKTASRIVVCCYYSPFVMNLCIARKP